MFSFTVDTILFLIFVAFVAIYEMILRGVLTMEILQAVFSGNGITYIFLVGAFLFLRKYLSSAPEKTQITKLEKSILTLNNEIQKMKGEAEICQEFSFTLGKGNILQSLDK